VKRDSAPARNALALARRPPARLADEIHLQKLWLAVQRTPWRSLAVLAASQSIETLGVAQILAQLAWRYRGQPSGVCDLRDLSMRLVDYHIREVSEMVDAGTRLFIALRSIFENPTAIPMARQADAVVLCVAVGETSFKAAKQTIGEIGRDRIIGSIIVRTWPEEPAPTSGG